MREPEEFTDIPHIDPSTEHEPIRGSIRSGIRLIKADVISGKIYQLSPVEDERPDISELSAE